MMLNNSSLTIDTICIKMYIFYIKMINFIIFYHYYIFFSPTPHYTKNHEIFENLDFLKTLKIFQNKDWLYKNFLKKRPKKSCFFRKKQ